MVKFLHLFIYTLDNYFIRSLVATVLLFIFFKLIWKKYHLFPSIKILRFLILMYAFTAATLYLLEIMFPSAYIENIMFSYRRAAGLYAFFYILALVCHILLPFLLLITSLKNNLYIMLLIVFAMNLGRIFESFVIIVTSIHQDNLPFYPQRELQTIGQGFAIGLILIAIPILIKRVKSRFI
ncbi:MAG: hypothetical protein AB8B72_06040 [Crocinitomicaceae bacterium]